MARNLWNCRDEPEMKRLVLALCVLVLASPLIGCGGGVTEGMPANPQPPGPPPDLKAQMDSFRKDHTKGKAPRAHRQAD